MSDKIIGIDLGTTFSAVGFVHDGEAVILPNGRERIIPSVVGFSDAGKLLVGTPGRNQLALYPENTVKSIKRKMGTNESVMLNGRAYTPAEISAIILREMKRIAEAALGETISRAVITVPAYFSDAARQATKDAGEIAGFVVERIINEPTAAALAYGLDKLDSSEIIAVYDLGGGTFDVSIIEINAGVLEVRASHGDVNLGGDDFDERLMNYLADQFQGEHGINPRSDLKARARLLRAAEEAKIRLSSEVFVRVQEEYLLERDGLPLHLDVEIGRDAFEALIAELLEGTLVAFDQALADASMTADQLDRILFVGGSTRIPRIWEMVAQHTGRQPMVAVNPDEAVALGAGVQAAIISGEPIDAILVDVTPHSLGIAVAAIEFGQLVTDRFGPIIHRNTTIPATYSERFSALHPDQTRIDIKIYQGEDEIASRNTLLGEYQFEGLQPEEKGENPTITVQFDLDVNGILNVNIQDRGSGKRASLTVYAEHRRLDVRQRDEASAHVRELMLDAQDIPDPTVPAATQALIARARTVADSANAGAIHVRGLLLDIDAAIRAEDDTLRDELSEQLAEALYDLEE